MPDFGRCEGNEEAKSRVKALLTRFGDRRGEAVEELREGAA
jgi:hypothetical protein